MDVQEGEKNVGNTICQFHQHFTRPFLYETALRSFSLVTVWL